MRSRSRTWGWITTSSGLFLVFEGVEGAGKTTQVGLLAEWLSEHGIAHVVAREPGGTQAGEEIRRLLLESDAVPARAELLLLLAARAALVDTLVRPALEEGRIVLADRYELSTLAYQGHGRGLPLGEIRRINAFATDGARPDLTLLLDVPLEEGEARRAGAGRDRIEREGRGFHERVADAYRQTAGRRDAIERVDGTGSPADVNALVIALLRARFPERFGAEDG